MGLILVILLLFILFGGGLGTRYGGWGGPAYAPYGLGGIGLGGILLLILLVMFFSGRL